MSNAINEISPLSERDCFYIVERYKQKFTYPLHRHKEYELNFIENGAGMKRIVGDSVVETGEYELVLIGGENLEHVWEQGNCQSHNIREITIQFSPEMFSEQLLSRNQFNSIRKMLDKAQRGISFPVSAIMKVYPMLDKLSQETRGFYQLLSIFAILYELSLCDEVQTLSNASFANINQQEDSRRVTKVYKYIGEHFREEVRLADVAGLVGMSPTAFSRFFKLRTGITLSDYVTNMRLGIATRLLADSTMSISEIAYECGFNNQSNFNRIFKKVKGFTPKEFRGLYHKKKIIC